MADRQRVELKEHRQLLGQIEARGKPLAPRRRAQPSQIHDVCGTQQVRGAGQRICRIGYVVGVQQDHVDHVPQRLQGLVVPVRAPDHRREVRHDDRIHDRVKAGERVGAEVDLHLLVHHPHDPWRRLTVVHDGDRVERLAALLHRAQDRARRVVAAHALQPVGDLALPRAVDDHDQVEDACRRQRLVGGVALAQHLTQRRLDGVGRRALL